MQNGVILCRLEFISSTICNRLCRYIVLIIVLCYGSYKNREDTIKNTLACIMFLKSKIYIAFFFFLLLEHRDWETTTFKWTITHKHIPVSHLSSTYLVTKFIIQMAALTLQAWVMYIPWHEIVDHELNTFFLVSHTQNIGEAQCILNFLLRYLKQTDFWYGFWITPTHYRRKFKIYPASPNVCYLVIPTY